MDKKKPEKEALVLEFRSAIQSSEWCDKAWLLAQTLTALEHPTLYTQLNQLRKQAMEEISKQLATELTVHYRFSFKPIKETTRTKKSNSWKLIDITPEISRDPQVANVGVPAPLVRRLRRLIREQIWLLRQFE